jgi:molybdopterin synthase catalytic subunit
MSEHSVVYGTHGRQISQRIKSGSFGSSHELYRFVAVRIVREKSVRYLLRGTRPSGALHKRYRTLISRSLLRIRVEDFAKMTKRMRTIVNPLSSMQPFVQLTHAPIEIQPLRAYLEDQHVGAHAWFEGVTRRFGQGRETVRLSYESFQPMALKELHLIADETAVEFGLTHLLIVHRLGEVPAGEASLIVGCSSPHRASVFSAIPRVVDRLKKDVPIWKQEHFADGSSEWVHPS